MSEDELQGSIIQPQETAEPEPELLAPIAKQERIAFMDVLRGIAVLGIFLINMPLFVGPSSEFFSWSNNLIWNTVPDRITLAFIQIFAQGKFYTLFSFLFGAGFTIQMVRAAERHNPNFLGTMRRRLTVLLTIGLLHFTLIWWGDVLHVYALLGFVLILFRNRRDAVLKRWIIALTLFPLIMGTGGTIFSAWRDLKKPEAERAKSQKEGREKRQKRLTENIQVKAHGTIPEILVFRLKRDAQQLAGEIGWGLELLMNFLLGLLAIRHGVIQHPERHKALLQKLAFIALPIGLALTAGDVLFEYFNPHPPPLLWTGPLSIFHEFIGRPAMAYGYAAVLLLIGIKSWMTPFAAVGRMALTNYLLHSTVFTTIANSYGLGMFGSVHPPTWFAWCFGFYALQIPFSMWWLSRHPYGPAEWVWRSLTYGKRQPWSLRQA